MKAYVKGSRVERELAKLLTSYGFMVVRAAGSGFKSPDLIAFKKGREYAIECKAHEGDKLSISADQFATLKRWEENSLMDVYVAWKKSRKPWVFIPLTAFKKARKNYVVDFEKALIFGKRIEELVF